MKTRFIKRSKKGVTLVESVFAVVILSIFATGIISLLTAGGVKIFEISQESGTHSQAVQKMDLIIASISNGAYLSTTEENLVSLDEDTIKTEQKVELTSRTVTFDGSDTDHTKTNVRGWYLTLTYNGVTVTGFASNTEGVFDTE